MLKPKDYHVIDLTLPFSNSVAGFDFEITQNLDEDGWNARDLTFYSHCGTHMDAPFHFGVSPAGIDSYPVQRLLGRAWIVDVEIRTSQQLITYDDMIALDGKFEPGDSILIRTGWSEKFGTDVYRDELPRIGEDLATWCVHQKVNMLGVEAPSVADVNNLEEVTRIHEILLGGDIIIIEGLCNLDQIGTDEVTLIALPLSIAGSDGSPARVIALAKKTL